MKETAKGWVFAALTVGMFGLIVGLAQAEPGKIDAGQTVLIAGLILAVAYLVLFSEKRDTFDPHDWKKKK